MKDKYHKIFEEIYSEFKDECEGWLMMNASLGRSGYDKFYKDKLFEKFEKYRWTVMREIYLEKF